MAGAAVQRRLIWRVADVVELIDETPNIRSVLMHLPDWPGHLAGQHVDVRLTADDGYQAQRSYSIASPPETEDRLTVTVERIEDGEVSPFLTQELRVGDKIELRGPIGGYFVWRVADGGPLMLIAGGSGVCPLMAMLRHRVARAGSVPARLLYSSRSPGDVIYRKELERLVGEGVDVVQTLTRIQPDGWTGYQRRVDKPMLQEVVWPPVDRPLVYVCGPTPFVESVAEALVELGHDAARIKTERFGPTGG